MYCKKCKSEIPDYSIFCTVCGTRQNSDEPGQQRAQGHPQPGPMGRPGPQGQPQPQPMGQPVAQGQPQPGPQGRPPYMGQPGPQGQPQPQNRPPYMGQPGAQNQPGQPQPGSMGQPGSQDQPQPGPQGQPIHQEQPQPQNRTPYMGQQGPQNQPGQPQPGPMGQPGSQGQPQPGPQSRPPHISQPGPQGQPRPAVKPQPAGKQKLADKPKKPKKSKKKLILLIALIVGIPLIAAIVLVGYFFIWPMIFKPAINLNDYATIRYEGYNTYGDAYIEFDRNSFREKYEEAVLEYVDGSFDKESGLSNGDSVTYTWNCKDEEVSDKYGYKLEYSNITGTVEGLKDAGRFDIFEGVDVHFEGISPYIKAEVVKNSDTEYNSGVDYYLDAESGLTDGDTVTLTAAVSDYEEAELISYFVETYGAMPEELTKTYTVKGMGSYVKNLNDIPVAGLTNLQQRAGEIYSTDVASDWRYDQTLESFNYIGSYLLTADEDEENYDTYNKLFLVYKVLVRDTCSSGGYSYDKINAVFWYVQFNDVYTDTSGNLVINDEYYYTPEATVTIDSGVSEGYSNIVWNNIGYSTLDELKNDAVTYWTNEYSYNVFDNITDNINVPDIPDSATPVPDDYEDEYYEEDDYYDDYEEEGIIFPNSSSEVISTKKIKKLSDADLQKAINEIYARNGYIFKDDTIRAYYEQYEWYEETVKPSDFSESLFNDIERSNVKTMQKERDKRKK